MNGDLQLLRMQQLRLRVYKLGGSLWDLPDLPERLLRVIGETISDLKEAVENETAFDNVVVIVTGGGAAVDELRQWAARYPQLDDRFCHDWALQQMTANARILQRSLSVPTSFVASLSEIEVVPGAAASFDPDRRDGRGAVEHSPPRILLLDAFEYARRCERDNNTRIPATWDISSDSIAAHVAWNWHATKLVLLKSTDLPECSDEKLATTAGVNWTAMSEAGLVDAAFAEYVARLDSTQIRWVNLRQGRAV